MKQILGGIATIAIILIIMFAIGSIGNKYTTDAVVGTNRYGEKIVTTKQGRELKCDTEIADGTKVIVTIDTHGTDEYKWEATDDTVIKIKIK